jgi:hypothetical protein
MSVSIGGIATHNIGYAYTQYNTTDWGVKEENSQLRGDWRAVLDKGAKSFSEGRKRAWRPLFLVDDDAAAA